MKIPKHIQKIMDNPDISKDIKIEILNNRIEINKFIEDSSNKFRNMLTP